MHDETPSSHERDALAGPFIPGGSSRDVQSVVSRDAEAVFADLHRATVALQLAIPAADLCEQLRKAVVQAATRDAESMKGLRLAVRSFTVALREMGTSPEHVLVALKTVINNRSLVPIGPYASDWSGQELRERISTWCIQEFFAEKTA